jgi:hypothetical protein
MYCKICHCEEFDPLKSSNMDGCQMMRCRTCHNEQPQDKEYELYMLAEDFGHGDSHNPEVYMGDFATRDRAEQEGDRLIDEYGGDYYSYRVKKTGDK